MGTMASWITSFTIVYSTVYSGAYQGKHQSSASLAFVRRIHQWPANSPHKWPVTRKMFPFDDVIRVVSIMLDSVVCCIKVYMYLCLYKILYFATYTGGFCGISCLCGKSPSVSRKLHSWKKNVTPPPFQAIRSIWIKFLCFQWAEIGMKSTCDCFPTKSELTFPGLQCHVGLLKSRTMVVISPNVFT